MTPSDFRRLAGSLYRRITGTVGRGVIRNDDDSGGRQTLQVEFAGGEIRSGIERFQQFGLSSRAPVDGVSEAIVLSVGGDRAHGVALATESRSWRPRASKGGETVLYSAGGKVITLYLQADGTLTITAPLQVTVNTPLATVNATTKVRLVTPRLEVTGDIIDHCDSGGQTLASLRTDYNAHTHTDSKGGATSAPSLLDQ